MRYIIFEGERITIKQAKNICKHYQKAFTNGWYKKETHKKQYKTYQELSSLIIKNQ